MEKSAKEIVAEVTTAVNEWRSVAASHRLSRIAQAYYALNISAIAIKPASVTDFRFRSSRALRIA
jgi:hypothetical protein